MTNQYHILPEEAPLDLIDAATGDQGSVVTLYAGDSDSGIYPKAPQNFDPCRHLMRMNSYWHQAQACPQQTSPIANTAFNSPEFYYTPESWFKFRKI